MIPSTRVNDATAASESKPRSNIKKDRTLLAKSDKKKVEDHSKNNKSSVKQKNHVDYSISYKRTNDIVERWNRTLIEATRTMLIFSKALIFLWVEVVATACYTQNQSLIHTRHNKTPYELVHDQKHDIKFLVLVLFVTQQMIITGPEPILLIPGKISSEIIPDHVLAAPYVSPTNKDLEILFQPMFDEYFEPPDVESYSLSSFVVQPPISHQGVAAGPTIKDNPFAQDDNDPFVNVFAPKPSSDESSSGDVSYAESTQFVHPRNHLGKWSKDHPLDNVICNPYRPVSTRKQLDTVALWCLYNSVLSKVKPNNVKTTMDEACWLCKKKSMNLIDFKYGN
nr:putative ribonuclease H-like domain-containing protein [Tanacetum cinerariifolium]